MKPPISLAAAMLLSLAATGGAAPPATDTSPKPEVLWAQAFALHIWGPALGPSAHRPEAVEALASILDGKMMSGSGGWFHPGQSRYDWKWLSRRQQIERDGNITRKQWRGPPDLFDRLDRDRDGAVTADDLDWSEQSAWLKQTALFKQWFGRLDSSSNGRVSRGEWESFFKQIAGDKDSFTPEQLQHALSQKGAAKAGPPKRDAKFTATLLKGLLSNELGSPYEGPRLNDEAPDFVLPTADGKQKLSLAQFRGKKPMALIFGSFT